MQNVAPFLHASTDLGKLKVNPLTREAYVWSMPDIPFRTYATYRVDQVDGVFPDLATQMPALFNSDLDKAMRGQFFLSSNHTQIIWKDLPFISPIITAKKLKSGEYVYASFFPNPKKNQPIPSELLSQITSRTNIIYYDWELTGPRLQQWRALAVILPLGVDKPRYRPASRSSQKAPPSVGSVRTPVTTPSKASSVVPNYREEWLTELIPYLGNSVTVATLDGVQNVTVERSSHIGFTGVELVLLSNWLNDYQGPGLSHNSGDFSKQPKK
jgi:hypothetical protein